jgi:hypothetical protein
MKRAGSDAGPAYRTPAQTRRQQPHARDPLPDNSTGSDERSPTVDGFELCYRTWLRAQTHRNDATGFAASLCEEDDQSEPVHCLYDQPARQEYMLDIWYSDKRPDD